MLEPKNSKTSWNAAESSALYQVPSWSKGYFSVGEDGNLRVQPAGPEGGSLDLRRLVEDMGKRGFDLPLLLRFSNILEDRVSSLCGAFQKACEEHALAYLPVYPIKVNQQRDVVEELVSLGMNHQLGLEAGSKPELLIALAHMDNPEALIICNGYKDTGYVETALLAQKLGRYPIIVIDRFAELEMIIRASRRLGMRPHIGVRARLSSRGQGRWQESSGEGSKFGLSADELVQTVKRLRRAGMLDCLELLHFHIGSQIASIRPIKEALRESCRIYVELAKMGAGLKFIDVGGGLGVDYDGSESKEASSINYSQQEYANDVIWAVQMACDEVGIPHPDVISESGRALTAHHAVLVFDVLGSNQLPHQEPDAALAEHECSPLRSLFEAWEQLNDKNFIETYHDAQALKDEALSLFKLGYLDLSDRAKMETVYSSICLRIRSYCRRLEQIPDDLTNLERNLADIYYCNFSVFQSLPDHWAVDQLFPIMPLHRLCEKPSRRVVLADLTCDSDGKVDQFIDAEEDKNSLELHELKVGEPYYLGAFLVGAYQETLGDLHNLFGDTTAIHISMDDSHDYSIERVVEGDSVSEVLGYVQYPHEAMLDRVRRACEAGVRKGLLKMEESALLRRRYREALAGYTYLVQEQEESATRSGISRGREAESDSSLASQ
ncbi:MAG: biosynthetic arginine decarboxylase [Planctomycetota bacterium]